jgi:hypothetical protein
MNTRKCESHTPLMTLLEYWLGELDAARESPLEEHLFACSECHARLRQLVDLGREIRDTVCSGEIGMILTPSFVSRLQQSGLQVREYRLQPGGSVNCTIAPEDDLVIAYLQAPLGGVKRLDLVGHDITAGVDWRIEDIAFGPDSGDVAVATDTAALRRLAHATLRMELRAVDGAQERLVASYTFNHSPHSIA